MKKLIYILILLTSMSSVESLLPVGVAGQTQIDTLKSVAVDDGTLFADNVVYLTARNATIGTGSDNNDIIIGQPTGFYVQRGFLVFKLSTISPLSVIDSIKIKLHGDVDYSDDEFDITSRSGYFITFATSEFELFDGWAATGAYGGVALTDDWNSDDYADEVYNDVGIFTSAGIDTIEAHLSDSLRIVFLSVEDINASEPTNTERVKFESGEVANEEPLLIIYSSTPAPTVTNFTIYSNTMTTFTWRIDTTLAGESLDSTNIVYVADSSVIQHFAGADTNGTVTGLTFDSLYIARAASYFSTTGVLYSNMDTVFLPGDTVSYHFRPDSSDGIDTYIDEWYPKYNYGDSSAMMIWDFDSLARILINFEDIYGIGDDCDSVRIDSAYIYLIVADTAAPGGYTEKDAKVHIVSSDYTAGSERGLPEVCNFDTAKSTICWEAAGGDYYPPELASVSVTGITMGDTVKITATNLIDALLDTMAITDEDYGVMVKFEFDGAIATNESYKILFFTSQAADSTNRPRCEIWLTRYGYDVSEIEITSARGNVIHEARGYITKTGRDVARKIINFVKKIGG